MTVRLMPRDHCIDTRVLTKPLELYTCPAGRAVGGKNIEDTSRKRQWKNGVGDNCLSLF